MSYAILLLAVSNFELPFLFLCSVELVRLVVCLIHRRIGWPCVRGNEATVTKCNGWKGRTLDRFWVLVTCSGQLELRKRLGAAARAPRRRDIHGRRRGEEKIVIMRCDVYMGNRTDRSIDIASGDKNSAETAI